MSHPQLNTFNPIALLTRFAGTENTGRLEVHSHEVSWHLYFENGYLYSLSCSVQSINQIEYHLGGLTLDKATGMLRSIPESLLSSVGSEQYDSHQLINRVLGWLVQSHYLTSQQAQQVLEKTMQEALESFLWLTEGTFAWTDQLPSQQVCILDLQAFLETFQNNLKTWQVVQDLVISPHQRPYLNNASALEPLISKGDPSAAILEKLLKLMRGKSLRQLAAILKQDEFKLVYFLVPFLRNQIIQLHDPQPPFNQLPTIPKLTPQMVEPKASKSPHYKIVCIDDSPTILAEMKSFLGQDCFEITTIDNPTKSISTLFSSKPDLILMDITMPGINGYQLCSLLRKGDPYFEMIPIIMVTGNRGIIDRAKAKLSGASDYLTKPFTREALLSIVHKHLNITDQPPVEPKAWQATPLAAN